MVNDAAAGVMEARHSCRCCLLRPPDKDLKTPYTHLDKTEIYSDMIKDCFNVDVYLANDECGICEACVSRLRDARDFKLQVQRSQVELQVLEEALHVSGEEISIKSERSDNSVDDMQDIIPYEETSIKSEMLDDDATRNQDFTTHEEPPLKSEMSDDATSHGDCISHLKLSVKWELLEEDEDSVLLPWSGGGRVPARAHAARAGDQLKMACSVRLERLRASALATHMTRAHASGEGDAHVAENAYPCKISSQRLPSKDNYSQRKIVHSQIKPHSSDVCKEFQLMRHKEVHTCDKPYVCHICGNRYKQKDNLIAHSTTHTGQKLYSCGDCNKPFLFKSDLIRHKRIHTGEKPYACDVCGKRFTRKGSLNTHIRTHMGLKPFGCEECDRRFTQKAHLIIHKRLHTGDKPYACDICGKKFTKKSNLTRHIRAHMGHKPFSCKECNRGFTEKCDLIRHKRIHTGEKLYACDICGKRYTQKSSLTRHIIIVHKGQKPFSFNVH